MTREEKQDLAKEILSEFLAEPGLMILNEKQKHLTIGAMIKFANKLASDGDLADVTHWVAVEDRLPDYPGDVLVIREDGKYRIAYFTSTGRFKVPNVTHWRQLKPPCG